MTKVQVRYKLLRKLDEAMLTRVARTHGVYGILRVEPDADGNALTVEYDATRLRPAEVAAVLGRAGIPVQES
jgi:ribosomal 30S subunit maturation factor RimM